MKLGELIYFLKEQDQDKIMKIGFKDPDSYRGDYGCVAFEPTINQPVSKSIEECLRAVNTTYTGWKGGSYLMTLETEVYLAYLGRCSFDDQAINNIFLHLVLDLPISEIFEELK